MTKFSKAHFLRCCGGHSPLKILLENRDTGSQNTFVFEQPSILVGQHPVADLRLNHPAISPRQLYLQMLDGHLFCMQLSNRGSLHFGGRPTAWGWVSPRDRLEFAPVA